MTHTSSIKNHLKWPQITKSRVETIKPFLSDHSGTPSVFVKWPNLMKNASCHLGDQTQRCACAICVRASCRKRKNSTSLKHADFKNVHFFMFILSRSRVISQKPPFLSPVASNVQKRWFFVYNSWTTQDKRIKVYIFEISVKFRVDWYAT